MDVVEREKEFWDEHTAFDWMAEPSKRDVIAMLPKLDGDVLELCIGSGMLTEHMPKTYRSYTGLDLSDTLLATLRRRMPSVRLVQGNAEELCFADASFDTVLVFAGLHHLPHFEQTIAQAHRVLRPNGTFACLEPSSRAWYRKPMDLLRGWIGIYSADEVFLDPRRVSSVLGRVGFGPVHLQYLTPRFSPAFLTGKNKVLAQLLYLAAGMGRSSLTQSFFLLRAIKA
jgi:ubiquinone/menaquinone biosynthesis C-methylase UbiE